MAHNEDIDNIPKSTVRAVAKKLKYYIDVQRREEAFDLSGVEHPMGAFTSSKGGSLYYNAMQDKLTGHVLSQPHLKKHTSEMGLKSPTKASPRPYSAIMNFIKQDSTMSQDSGKLVNTTSKLLLKSNIKHLDRTGSAPSTLRTPASTKAARHLNRPFSSNSTMPSSTNSELASRSYPRKKRSGRHLNQSTPITHSVPIMTSNRRNFQPPTIQTIDLGSSISSSASSLQSPVPQSPEDDELLQYTYHGVSKKPSVTDTLFTRSDSALCVPAFQKRIVTINKTKVANVVEEASSSKEPANNIADISLPVNNNSSSAPLQVSQSTQDASVQVNSSSSLMDQTADNKKAVVQSTATERTTAASTSMQSIGLQVTECCDSSTQTLSEVGIQTDLSAIMDQKRAERRQLKKQSRENISQDISNPPTVVITSDSTVQLKQEAYSDDITRSSANPQTEQELEAARKEEELRRHIAATTIQQYYRGFKSGIRAKKSEQQIKEQELSVAQEKKSAGISIHEAAWTGNVDRIKELSLEASSLINLIDERGYTPLHCAAESGSLESVKMLSICGADMHKETPTGYTAIHIAALSGHVNCLKLLHALECSLKCQTVDRKTPLHLAAMRGHLECCKWLLSNRAKLNVKDENDRTPLQLAEESEQPQIVNLLTSYENELKYAKGALKQLRARRSNSTEHTDDEGWLSDTKQPESAIKPPATIVEEQKQFYEKIQLDKEESDSTFLDVARIAVEKEQQTTEEQPDQHKLDDQYQQNDNQDANQGQQNNDQDHQSDDQDHPDQQNNDLDHQGRQNDQDHQGQQTNDQDNQDQQPNSTQDNNQSHISNDQGKQVVDQSQSQQDVNDQANTDELTGKTSTAEVGHQNETSTDKQIVTSQSEVPIQTTDTPQTSDATENVNTAEAVTVHEEAEDMQKQKEEVTTDVSNTQNIVVTDDGASTKPEPTTQDTTQKPIQIVTQDSNSQQTLPQDDFNRAKAATESEDKTDTVAELSIANLAAHNIVNPPLIERTDTLQTLTTVTMLDNPIRLEQFSRSSLDSDYSKKQRHQQIVQTVSTMAVNGDGKQNDDVIAITGTVDTAGAAKSSISSSTLSNITDLTE